MSDFTSDRAQNTPPPALRGQRWVGRVTLLLAILILVPSLFGFASKFVEFVHLSRGNQEGAFAVAPVVNYLAASLGFLCLFGWAAANGMFHDIERPKYRMLENEAELDAALPPATRRLVEPNQR